MNTDDIRRRIYEQATPSQAAALRIDDYYGSPAAFWLAALAAGLVTRDEYEFARVRYGSMWHYRGD